jgi:hypothetical protein
MNANRFSSSHSVGFVVGCVLLAGCASEPPAPQLAVAGSTLSDAERAGAVQPAGPAPLGPQPTEIPAGPRLTAEEIRSTMVGKTWGGARTGTLLTDWKMYVAPDGTAVQSGGETGRWNISQDGQFCMQWPIDEHRQLICQTVYREGNGVVLQSPTSEEMLTMEEGNTV